MKFCAVVFVCLPVSAIAGSAVLTQTKNTAAYYPKYLCQGTADDLSALKDTGITADSFVKGVPCVIGDFDGNGSIDFALMYLMKRDCQNCGEAHRIRVLLMDKTKIIRALPAAIFRKNGSEQGFFSVEARPGGKTKKRESWEALVDCKIPKNDFILENGQGDSNHIVSYDPKKGTFIEFSSCSSESG